MLLKKPFDTRVFNRFFQFANFDFKPSALPAKDADVNQFKLTRLSPRPVMALGIGLALRRLSNLTEVVTFLGM